MSTILLYHFDNESLKDETGVHSAVATNCVESSAGSIKFGAASLDMASENSYVTINSVSSSLSFGTSDWSIDFQYYRPDTGVTRSALQLVAATNEIKITVDSNEGGGNNIKVYIGGSIKITGTAVSSHGGELWQHWALVRDGNYLRLYVDGVHQNSYDVTGQSFDFSSLKFGTATGFQYSTNGWLDELRVTNDASWANGTNGFTPPTEEWPLDEEPDPEPPVIPILCWKYSAKYKNSNRIFSLEGPNSYPNKIKVPSNIDLTTSKLIEDGQIINPSNYKLI